MASRSTEWTFRIVAMLFPLAVLASAELVLRGCAPDLDPYVHLRDRTSIFSEVEVDGTRFVQVTHPEAYSTRATRFAVEKPPGTLRVFCFGGSASAGWPHPAAQAYTGFLARALRRAHPGQRFEVMNLGAHAHASYRVRFILEDLIDYDPDLVVIYSGNNDFLERRRYDRASQARRALERFGRQLRLVAWLGRAAESFGLGGPSTLDGRTATVGGQKLVWSMVQRTASELRSDPEQFAAVLEHYEYSLGAMVEAGRKHGVPVLLLTVPVNLQDWQPNASEPSVSDGFEAALALGRNALDEGRGPAAVAAFDRALALAPRNADAHFFRGRALLRLGRDAEARQAFESAVRFDQNPFRALPVMNDIVRRVAAGQPGAILVDAERAFARASATGSPGFDLFLDYVHPSLRGNRVLAAAVYDAIREHDLLGLEPPMVRINFRTQEAAAAGYRDEDDLAMQGVMLWAFGLNRQEETLVARARALRPRLIDAEEPIGEEARLRMLAFIDDVESSVAPALDRARAERAGHALPPAEATHVSANLDAFYRRWYEEGNRPWTDARL